jgi:hypothetical protein
LKYLLILFEKVIRGKQLSIKSDKELLAEFDSDLKNTSEYKFLIEFLKPLVDNAKHSEFAREFLEPCGDIIQNRFQNMGKRMLNFKNYSKAQGKDEVTVLGKAFVYLGLFETSVTNLVDLILLVLVVNHHDFYIDRSRKYATKLDDLDKASLGEKLIFLNKHHLQIFARNLNKTLRNKIAHLDFDINSDGTITANGQKYNLENEILILSAFVLVVAEALKYCGIPDLLKKENKN